ncbi:unnamed protein product [Symbiodinium sp. KB8]|nr:unnamed protein product [Symbiodinium sp. KB8]
MNTVAAGLSDDELDLGEADWCDPDVPGIAEVQRAMRLRPRLRPRVLYQDPKFYGDPEPHILRQMNKWAYVTEDTEIPVLPENVMEDGGSFYSDSEGEGDPEESEVSEECDTLEKDQWPDDFWMDSRDRLGVHKDYGGHSCQWSGAAAAEASSTVCWTDSSWDAAAKAGSTVCWTVGNSGLDLAMDKVLGGWDKVLGRCKGRCFRSFHCLDCPNGRASTEIPSHNR